MPARERLIIEDDQYGRIDVTREPSPDLVPFRQLPANDVEDWRGCGAERGEYESQRQASVEYLPPRSRNA